MKKLHRLIVVSNTYRQDSRIADPPPVIATQTDDARQPVLAHQQSEGSATIDQSPLEIDPDNRLLWRMNSRRMEAEVVRDSILFVAGQLDLTLGGQPIENDQENSSRRRSIYFSVYPEDGGHARFLETFDAPDACDCYRRTESMVPQQALALTNSRTAVNQARLLARKLWDEVLQRENHSDLRQSALISTAFEQVLSRAPMPAELTICIEFLQKQAELFTSAEFSRFTAAPSDGLVAASADPRLRAYESLVHSLFSHNDFVIVR
jgi:hypothetical protein